MSTDDIIFTPRRIMDRIDFKPLTAKASCFLDEGRKSINASKLAQLRKAGFDVDVAEEPSDNIAT